jgi:hypothetical protein
MVIEWWEAILICLFALTWLGSWTYIQSERVRASVQIAQGNCRPMEATAKAAPRRRFPAPRQIVLN